MTATLPRPSDPSGPDGPIAADAVPSRRPGAVASALRLAATQLRVLVRDTGVVVGLLAFPAVTVLVIAGVFGSTPDPDFGGSIPSEHYVVGYVGVVLASLGLTALPAHVAADRELGILRRFRAAGLDGRVIVGSYTIVGLVLGVVSALIVLGIGAAAYGVPDPVHPLGVVAWFAAGLLCFIAIGGALGVLLRTSRSASAVGTMVFVPMFLLGGGGPPQGAMSGPMQAIARALPLSHIVGGMRLAWLGRTDDPHQLWYPVAVAIVALVAAAWMLRRQAD